MKARTGIISIILIILTVSFFTMQVKASGGEATEESQMEQLKEEADSFLSSSVVSDFLAMDSEDFESKYDRNRLYEEDILYCDMAAWRFSEYYGMMRNWENSDEYFHIGNVTAVRYIVDDSLYDFVEENHADRDSLDDNSSATDVYIQHMGDYAISIYYQRNTDDAGEDSVKLLEISFVKVEVIDGSEETATRTLYQFLEEEYYYGRENILSSSGDGRGGWPDDWIISPDGNKEICVLNGGMPNNPAQIFIRYRDKRPDTVFRFGWEQGIAGWIDDEHVVCYTMDSNPKLIHLETNQIEEIEIPIGDNGRRVFDAYGAHYEISGNHLIARYKSEELYRWDIVKENQEVHIVEIPSEETNE